MPGAAAVYCRISDDREGRQLGVARQEQDCRALAERLGWPVAEVYVDNDISAYSGKPRPAYRRMLRDLKEGTRDAIIVYHQDRLVRLNRELEEFFDLCDAAGIKAFASVTGELDLGNEEQRDFARILGIFAQRESGTKARRIRRKHQELAEQGKVSGGGTRPYGYTADRRHLDQSEARVIRRCVKRILAGESLRAVATSLNDRGIPTVTGKAWTPSTLKRMLVSARISGQREHHGEIISTSAEWPAIIRPEDTARLRARLAPAGPGAPRSPRRYLLAGLLRCHRCGATMLSRPRADGARRYVCAKGPGLPGCGSTSILARDIEPYVADAVLSVLDSPRLEAALRGEIAKDDEAAAVQADIDEAHVREAELAQMFALGEITRREWLAARTSIQAQLDQLSRKQSRLSSAPVLRDVQGRTDLLRRQWPELDLTRQQAIVKAVLDHLVVRPALRGRNRFDPARLDPVWRL